MILGNEARKDDLHLLGIDLGFVQGKIVGKNGYSKKYPAVVGTPSAWQLQGDPDGMVVGLEEMTYYVGEKAIRDTDNGRLNFQVDKTNTESDRVKYLAALGAYMEEQGITDADFIVVTGLPVYEYNELKDEVRKNMEGKFSFEFSETKPLQSYKANVVKVIVVPQGAGGYYDSFLDDTGVIARHDLSVAKVLGVDPGGRTTDIIAMEAGKYISKSSFTIDRAVADVHKEVIRRLRQEYGISKTMAEVDEIVRRGSIKLRGEEIDVLPLILEAAEPIAQFLVEEIRVQIRDLQEYDKIILFGGGAVLFEGYFRKAFGNDIVEVLPDSEFSNASGFYKYGILKYSKMLTT